MLGYPDDVVLLKGKQLVIQADGFVIAEGHSKERIAWLEVPEHYVQWVDPATN